MNQRKAKRIRKEAYIQARGVGREHWKPERAHQLMKEIYNSTPRTLRHKFFGYR